jgi:hypothetical protein
MLGHSKLETTKIYLHTPEKIIREIGAKLIEARTDKEEKKEQDKKTVEFKVL